MPACALKEFKMFKAPLIYDFRMILNTLNTKLRDQEGMIRGLFSGSRPCVNAAVNGFFNKGSSCKDIIDPPAHIPFETVGNPVIPEGVTAAFFVVKAEDI